MTGTYSNAFTLHNVLTHRTVTVKARDDARDPLVINQHFNYTDGGVGFERPMHTGLRPTPQNVVAHYDAGMMHSNPNASLPLNSATPAIDPATATAAAAPASTFPSSSSGPSPADYFNHVDPSKSPNYRKKVLKVAWHPRINAVAIAGLYKLYLYSAKAAPPAPPIPT